MTKTRILICCLLFISLNSNGQNNTNKKIDSLSIDIDKCINCSRDHFARAKLSLAEDKMMEAMSDLNKAIEIHIEYFLKDVFDNIHS